jgi:Flp pilus assembly protein TadB
MGKKLKNNSVERIYAEQKKNQVHQYTRLLVANLILSFVFKLAIFFTAVGVAALLVSRPPEMIHDASVLILCAILIVPLYYVWRKINRRFHEVKEQLER